MINYHCFAIIRILNLIKVSLVICNQSENFANFRHPSTLFIFWGTFEKRPYCMRFVVGVGVVGVGVCYMQNSRNGTLSPSPFGIPFPIPFWDPHPFGTPLGPLLGLLLWPYRDPFSHHHIILLREQKKNFLPDYLIVA